MILVCPCCGATASAEAWAQDAAIRQTVARIVRLPKPVQEHVFAYLALFRPERRALSWARARRVVGDLADLVAAGTVQWERKPPRPCPPEIWARAMADMIERKGGFKAHFTNHNYLRSIAYDLADRADAEAERRREQARLRGWHRQEEEDAEALPPEEVRRLIAQTKARLGMGGARE